MKDGPSGLMDALIGHTGFVGGTLSQAHAFEACFNSRNIDAARGGRFGLLVCAGVRAEKWIANRDEAADLRNIRALLDVLTGVHAERAVLISTTDVYADTRGRTENDAVDLEGNHPYGRDRAIMEKEFQRIFPGAFVVRLPGLFGAGLKKNVVHDLIKDHEVYKINTAGRHQYYDVGRLWDDLSRMMERDIHVLNICSPPIQVEDLCREVFGVRYHHPAPNAADYDMRTVHDAEWGRSDGYLYGLDEVLAAMKRFVDGHPDRRPLQLPATS
ncbi:MAG: hypothetical protein KDB97_00835 [Flavobacteriales bacterium]|nr:hypothetical protein [Flavobacteriales bacterium]